MCPEPSLRAQAAALRVDVCKLTSGLLCRQSLRFCGSMCHSLLQLWCVTVRGLQRRSNLMLGTPNHQTCVPIIPAHSGHCNALPCLLQLTACPPPPPPPHSSACPDSQQQQAHHRLHGSAVRKAGQVHTRQHLEENPVCAGGVCVCARVCVSSSNTGGCCVRVA